MKINEIKEFLEDNDLNDIEVIKEDDDLTVIRFYYDFDEDELKAAQRYNEENSEFGVAEYLNDLAVDNVGEVIQEIAEELDISGEFVSYEPYIEEEYNEFVGVFYIKGKKLDVNDILEELEL